MPKNTAFNIFYTLFFDFPFVVFFLFHTFVKQIKTSY